MCVFDADNLAAPDFLTKMNEALQNGADVTQGYRETVNPEESWVSGCYAVYWMFLMRFFYRARQTLGMSCMVCGTGFAFKMEVLEPGRLEYPDRDGRLRVFRPADHRRTDHRVCG